MKDIESQTKRKQEMKTSVLKTSSVKNVTMAMGIIGCLFVMLFVVSFSQHSQLPLPSSNVDHSRKLLAAQEDPRAAFFAAYQQAMIGEGGFNSFDFLPHSEESRLEAEYFAAHGRSRFEADYTKFAGQNYMVVTVGSTSVQILYVLNGRVQNVPLDVGQDLFTMEFGTSMVEDGEMDKFMLMARLLDEKRKELYGDQAQDTVILLCNSIGHLVNAIYAHRGSAGELAPLTIGADVPPIEPGSVPGDGSANFVVSFDAATKALGMKNVWIKPRLAPFIDNSWAAAQVSTRGLSVLDLGGGQTASVRTVGGKKSRISHSEKVNDRFSRFSQEMSATTGQQFAQSIIEGIRSQWDEDEMGSMKSVYVGQTGKARNEYAKLHASKA